MSQITKIEMWKDTGFQEGSVEVPSVNDILPELESSTDNYIKIAYDGGIRTSTADFFSGFTIPEFFTDDILGFSYIRIHYTYNSGYDMIFYGWIDDISLKSDTADNPSIHISWHIDYWRTYLASAKFGYGLVQSRPVGPNDPPQSCSYRYRLGGDFKSLVPDVTGSNVNWLVFTYVNDIENNKVTEIRTCAVPLDKDNLDTVYSIKVGDTAYSCPSMNDIATGKFLSKLGISATQVTSAFICPIPPFEISSFSGTTFVVKTSATETTADRKTQDFDDSRMKRVTSTHFQYGPNYGSTYNYFLTVNFSDGTKVENKSFSAYVIESDFKNYLDGLNGVSSGGILNVTSGSCYNFTVSEFMASVFSTTTFTNGDTVTFNNVTDTRTTSVSGNTSKVNYNVTLGTLAPMTFTYDNGWPSTRIYSNARVTGVYSYDASASVFSVGIDRKDTNHDGYIYTKSQNFAEYAVNAGGMKTTDTSEVIFTDMSGIPIGTSPWGITLTDGTMRPIISSVSAYIQYRFDGLYSASDGIEFTVPLPPVDICSNSYVDYVFSGQRDYDISQRKIASQQALVSGITSTITGSVSNTIMAGINPESATSTQVWAALSTSQVANLQKSGRGEEIVYRGGNPYQVHQETLSRPALSKMVGSGVASLGSGIGGAVAEYAFAQYFNGQLQKAEDMLQAKQFDSISVSGSGWDWLWHGRDIGIITLVPDDYSLDRYNADKRLNGIYCSEPTEDCDYVRTSEGPYRISELIVTGSIPVQARAHIKGRFANGVRIRTINTETVTEGD